MVKQLAQGNTMNQWQSWESTPVFPDITYPFTMGQMAGLLSALDKGQRVATLLPEALWIGTVMQRHWCKPPVTWVQDWRVAQV